MKILPFLLTSIDFLFYNRVVGDTMNKKDGPLKLQVTRLVLKKDLGYSLSDKEQEQIEEMTEEEMILVRNNLLKNIRDHYLALDTLEEYLEDLKEEEYRNYLSSHKNPEEVEMHVEKLAELEGKYTQMIINIANQKSSKEDLLGPSIHETYGHNRTM